MSEKVYIFDTTLRDGEQTPGVNLNLTEKLEIARQLEKLGVDWIEAGFPAVSDGEFEAVQAVGRQAQHSGVAALCRCVKGDIDRGYEALKDCKKPRLHVFIATSDLHMEYKLRMTPDEVIKRAVESVRYAKSLCEVFQFSAEDASRSDMAFLCKVIESVIDAGAVCINLPDTVGYALPEQYGQMIDYVVKNVPNIGKAVISVHCHDDLGLSVANTLSAIENGARQVEGTINGLGERAGNAALEEIIMALHTRDDMQEYYTGANTRQIYHTSRLVASLTGVDVAPNKAIVGANAFRHESGIHQHGMMAHANTYQIMQPEDIGLPPEGMILGKHSGRHAFAQRLEELGYVLTKEQLDTAFANFKTLADKKKEITDRDLEAVAQQKLVNLTPIYEIESYQIQSGDKIIATASVELKHKGELIREAAVGDGPVNALYQAINKLVCVPVELDAYGLRAVTEGADALGEVTARVKCQGELFTGRGLSTDVIQSSAHAYINAINRAISHLGLDQEGGPCA